MDRRATAEVTWLKEHVGAERIFSVTANRLEDHPALVNLLWERNHRPEHFRRIATVLTIDGYISFRLTGQATVHYSAAPFYGAYDILGRRFDPDLLEAMGVDPALLPRLCACEDVIGEVSPEAAADSGLVAGIPVAGGQVDCNAGWLQGGAIEPGDIQMNLGTAGNFGIIHRDRDFLFSHVRRAPPSTSPTRSTRSTPTSRCPPPPPAAAPCATCATSSRRRSWRRSARRA